MLNFTKITLLSFILGFGVVGWGQNLVPNPSFENFTTCPFGSFQIDKVIGWSNAGGSPDYFNSCALAGGASVPSNFCGYQEAKYGNAYIGIYTFNKGVSYPNNREHIQTTLTSPLSIGTNYHVSFDISFTLDNIEIGYASNKLGFLFTNVSSYTGNNSPPLSNNSHVFIDSIVSDSAIWYHFEGSFTSDSSYQNLIIGNFFDDINTDTTEIDNSLYTAYYYIDNVCVSSDSLDCISTVGVNEQLSSDFNVYPNPLTTGELWIELPNIYLNTDVGLSIYNNLGQLIESESIHLNNTQHKIDLTHLNNGVYYIKIENTLLTTKKIIIHQNQ